MVRLCLGVYAYYHVLMGRKSGKAKRLPCVLRLAFESHFVRARVYESIVDVDATVDHFSLELSFLLEFRSIKSSAVARSRGKSLQAALCDARNESTRNNGEPSCAQCRLPHREIDVDHRVSLTRSFSQLPRLQVLSSHSHSCARNKSREEKTSTVVRRRRHLSGATVQFHPRGAPRRFVSSISGAAFDRQFSEEFNHKRPLTATGNSFQLEIPRRATTRVTNLKKSHGAANVSRCLTLM